jgi:hypothetical protein
MSGRGRDREPGREPHESVERIPATSRAAARTPAATGSPERRDEASCCVVRRPPENDATRERIPEAKRRHEQGDSRRTPRSASAWTPGVLDAVLVARARECFARGPGKAAVRVGEVRGVARCAGRRPASRRRRSGGPGRSASRCRAAPCAARSPLDVPARRLLGRLDSQPAEEWVRSRVPRRMTTPTSTTATTAPSPRADGARCRSRARTSTAASTGREDDADRPAPRSTGQSHRGEPRDAGHDWRTPPERP